MRLGGGNAVRVHALISIGNAFGCTQARTHVRAPVTTVIAAAAEIEATDNIAAASPVAAANATADVSWGPFQNATYGVDACMNADRQPRG